MDIALHQIAPNNNIIIFIIIIRLIGMNDQHEIPVFGSVQRFI